MKIVRVPLEPENRSRAAIRAVLLMFLVSLSVAAQSTDIEYPLPVRSSEIDGRIAPRDLGDARLTRYFYSLSGTPGDLVVTVESRNLEGDVDVFTAGTLRPLAHIPMYGSVTTSNGSKTIYFKNREPLILRVEGRTPNDDDGSFRIRFHGAFEPISSDVPDPEPVVPTVSSSSDRSKQGRRVTATGARIDEPEPEPQPTETTRAETETPTTTPSATPSTPETPAETAEATKPPTPRPRTPRNRRTRPPTRVPRSAPTARRTPTPVVPAQPAEPASGPRLILEMRDGMRVERYMTTVRRVTVENGQIVVVTKDGKVDRQPMSNVLRMAIEP